MFKFYLFLGLIAQLFTKGYTIEFLKQSSPQNVSAVTQFIIKNCGINTDLVQNLVLSVEPVLPQSDYTLYLSGDLSKDVTGGTSKYDVTYNFIPLSPTTNDLCTEIKNSNITCPLNVGHIQLQSKGTVPTGLSGSVTIKNQWFDLEGIRILCMSFIIKI
jgi:hypothetical protein